MFDQHRQTSQRKINVRKQQFKNFSGRGSVSDYKSLLSILNAFTLCNEEYYPKCYNVNDAKGL